MIIEKYSLEYHKQLNPKLFDNEKLKDDVRHTLLEIAYEWMDFAGIPESSVTDIIFTGSNCNFNYSRFSDCDVHVVFDPREFSNLAAVTFAKTLWSAKHNIKVKGYAVELYAQPSDDELVASGVYSLSRNGWIKKPVYSKEHHFGRDEALIKKVEGLKSTIDMMIQNKVPLEQFKIMKYKLKNMRQAGLVSGSEFSLENSTFKALRNTGVLNRMNRYMNQERDRELSL